MTPQQQAAVLRQVADDLEHGKCAPNFLAAVLAGLLSAEQEPRSNAAKGPQHPEDLTPPAHAAPLSLPG